MSPLNVAPDCYFYSLGLVPYTLAWAWQRSLLQERCHNPELPDVLMLLEHPPVYTLGQGADPGFLKFDPQQENAELHRIERGGEVTYHCPGQLVGYPILNLRRHRQDLHWYLRQLEEVILQVLANLGLKGDRIPGLTGVWIEEVKVAAIGIKVSRWITMHGFALNVCPDLQGFEKIIPCGIPDKPIGSLAQFIPNLTVEQVQPMVICAFTAVFGVKLIVVDKRLFPLILDELDLGKSDQTT
ncbi:MAG: lipoyl(octanoyl) transferase LipB [Microcoleaceae cyanobacterium]